MRLAWPGRWTLAAGREGSPESTAASRAHELLDAAGRALDPNGAAGGRDLPCAAARLTLAMAAAAALLSQQPPGEVVGAVGALDDRMLKATFGSGKRAIALARAISGSTSPHVADLQQAELAVAELLERAVRGRRLRHAKLRVYAALAVLVLAIGASRAVPALARRMSPRFHASSHIVMLQRCDSVSDTKQSMCRRVFGRCKGDGARSRFDREAA
jgi:hypothetical protein